jgi:hypothetical protein
MNMLSETGKDKSASVAEMVQNRQRICKFAVDLAELPAVLKACEVSVVIAGCPMKSSVFWLKRRKRKYLPLFGLWR